MRNQFILFNAKSSTKDVGVWTTYFYKHETSAIAHPAILAKDNPFNLDLVVTSNFKDNYGIPFASAPLAFCKVNAKGPGVIYIPKGSLQDENIKSFFRQNLNYKQLYDGLVHMHDNEHAYATYQHRLDSKTFETLRPGLDILYEAHRSGWTFADDLGPHWDHDMGSL